MCAKQNEWFLEAKQNKDECMFATNWKHEWKSETRNRKNRSRSIQ